MGKGALIGDIRVDGYDPFLSHLSPKEVANRLTERNFDKIANAYLGRLESMLKPGGSQNVGASGKASRNFVVERRESYGFVQVGILEGTETAANQLMRQGIPSGKWQAGEMLKRWAAHRGLTLYHPQEHNKEGPNQESVLDIIGPGRGNPRSRFAGRVGQSTITYKPSQITGAALGAIKNAIFAQGSNRPTANWYNKYPTGGGRFDYPVVAFRQNQKFVDRLTLNLGTDVSAALIRSLFSGRKAGFY